MVRFACIELTLPSNEILQPGADLFPIDKTQGPPTPSRTCIRPRDHSDMSIERPLRSPMNIRLGQASTSEMAGPCFARLDVLQKVVAPAR